MITDQQSSETDVTQLRESRIRHLYYQGIWGVRGSLAAAVILTVALWGSIAPAHLILWLFCYTVLCGLGEALTWGFSEEHAQGMEILSWGRRFVSATIVAGVLWGLTPIFLFPRDSLFSQAMLTFALGGMSVGITTSHGVTKEAWLPFIFLVYVPLIGRYFYEGDPIHVSMGALLFIFMLYLVGSASRMHRTVVETLRLQYEKQKLIEVLTQEKETTERLNDVLRSEIQERKRAHAALRQSEERYRQLFEISPHAMTVHGKGKILLANPAAAKLVNASGPDALIGRTIWEFVHDDLLAEFQERLDRLEQNGGATELTEWKLRDLNNTVLDVEVASVASTYKEMHAILTVTRDITQAKRAQEKLKVSLEEKEILLREIHHRVKNNLQIISSLLRLQLKYAGTKSLEDIFNDSQNRLQSMALLHEKLYRSEDLAKVDFRPYVGALLSNLIQSYGSSERSITFKNEVGEIRLCLDTAIPCGLIINELVSNCLKHAFHDGRPGSVEVGLNCVKSECRLTIADDGVGFPPDLDRIDPGTLGLRLVNTLVSQLRGQVRVNSSRGTAYEIMFREHGRG